MGGSVGLSEYIVKKQYTVNSLLKRNYNEKSIKMLVKGTWTILLFIDSIWTILFCVTNIIFSQAFWIKWIIGAIKFSTSNKVVLSRGTFCFLIYILND